MLPGDAWVWPAGAIVAKRSGRRGRACEGRGAEESRPHDTETAAAIGDSSRYCLRSLLLSLVYSFWDHVESARFLPSSVPQPLVPVPLSIRLPLLSILATK